MAYTQTDLDNIEKAIANGLSTIRYSDGRSVTYRTQAELEKVRDIIKKELAKASGKRRKRAFVARTSKGL